jgi:hypothetical protein
MTEGAGAFVVDGVGGIAAVEDSEDRRATGVDQGAAMISESYSHGADGLTVPGERRLVPAGPADAGGAHHDIGS